MAKFPKTIESCEVKGDKLVEPAGQTTIRYSKSDFNIKGEGYPVEDFDIYDPTQYPDRDMPRYTGGFSANIIILRNEDGTIYPQISIINGNKSFSVWDGVKRKGTSGLKLVKMEELSEEQKQKVDIVLKIFKEALCSMMEKNKNNPTFEECFKFFGFTAQNIASI